MKKLILTLIIGLLCMPTYAVDSLTEDFVTGNPEIGSINAMTFGPEGILFLGDSKNSQVVAVDMSSAKKATNQKLYLKDIEALLGQLLGSDSDQLQIIDMVVNPVNQNIYLGAQHSSGKSFLFLVNNNTLENVPLKSVSFSKVNVSNVVNADAKDRRGRPLRSLAITDIQFANGQIMVSGLSNAEFASTFRAIPFPFTNKQSDSSLEIYHAAHGKYETHAPIKTFMTTTINNQPHIIASYTCTPLVVFPMESLTPGSHTKGRTVAELGNWNTPLDIIEMTNNKGKRFILMANSNRALMKFKVSDIESFGNSLTTRVKERAGTDGVDFINLPFVNVQQLDKLNEKEFVFIQRESNGKLALKTSSNRWL
ncbi:hypothetical protein [uncultured Tenacibaculum sp.]|uniref:hypothetical protein n=1 Tax=uncultured Tenacibaculum sp. TaxID=174713 RepID=UPI0026052C00|nr:hypothetical protein [uncultured Tenacibaculum sp.]